MAAGLAGWISTAAVGSPRGADATAASAGADASGTPANRGSSSGVPASGLAAEGSATSGADAEFDRSLLSGAGQNTTDLARFQQGSPVMPGSYSADIYLNDAWVGRSDVRFVAATPNVNATPCVDRRLLDQLGLHPDNPPALVSGTSSDMTGCASIGSLVPDATMAFDMASLRLDTSVPQAYLKQQPRGYVSPQYWDAGVPAALLNYNFNGYHTGSQGRRQTSGYLGLNAGFNIGLWHFRQDSSFNWQSATTGAPAHRQWQDIDTYAQREMPSLRALFTIGDSYTDGQVFNSFALRGIQLVTDDRMLPQSLQGYAPSVRGVAQTNALVSVRQNGVLIYQATVAPGPFEINDLYPTGYGGSLDVAVTEADGRVRLFSVPYASVAQLLRPGITRFDLAAGTLRGMLAASNPAVVQGTVQHGFSNLLTGYAGVAGSPGYAAALAGTALNTRYGAVAFDLTQARAQIPGIATQSGHSLRLSYSKILPESDTSLTVAAYRYSSSGYLSLTDAALARDYAHGDRNVFDIVTQPGFNTPEPLPTQSLLTAAQQAALLGGSTTTGLTLNGLQRQRNSFSIRVNQRLGPRGGSFYLNGSANDYWNRSGTSTQFQVGYNNAFRRVNYSISALRTLDLLGHDANQYLLSFTVPMGDGVHAPSFSFNATQDDGAGSRQQAIINGTAGADNQFTYGTTATRSGGGVGNSGSVNGGYRSPYGVFNASYGSGSGYSQSSLGMSGGIVAHPGGVTLGQPMGDTVGIVYVPDAAGARLANAAGARIDHFGYAVVPYLTPYMQNSIEIDPKGLPLDVQLDATSARVVPLAGAVVMLTFKTESGRTVIMRVHLPDGQSLPFGAEVVNAKGLTLGMTGQSGQVLLRGVEQAGRLTARWVDASGAALSCSLPYQLAPGSMKKHLLAYEEIQATCDPATDVLQASRNQQ